MDPLGLIGAALTPDPGTPFSRVAALEASLYMRNQLLRDADWAGMAHSLEIRVPLVDSVLLRRVAPILARGWSLDGKAVLARAPIRPLPGAVMVRPKTGFTTPVESWQRRLPLSQQLRGHGADSKTAWARRWAATLWQSRVPG
jgi:asparagine synthase (glutamine-hydrolysing)